MESTIKLKPEYIKLIQDNPALHGAIAQKVNKSLKTIERWCDSNDDRLTMLSVLDCIRQYKGLAKSVVLTHTVNELKAA